MSAYVLNRPSTSDVAPLVVAYYQTHPVGGSLHILLDDGNTNDDSAAFCLASAQEKGDVEGEQLAQLIAYMTETQRRKLYALPKSP